MIYINKYHFLWADCEVEYNKFLRYADTGCNPEKMSGAGLLQYRDYLNEYYKKNVEI